MIHEGKPETETKNNIPSPMKQSSAARVCISAVYKAPSVDMLLSSIPASAVRTVRSMRRMDTLSINGNWQKQAHKPNRQ